MTDRVLGLRANRERRTVSQLVGLLLRDVLASAAQPKSAFRPADRPVACCINRSSFPSTSVRSAPSSDARRLKKILKVRLYVEIKVLCDCLEKDPVSGVDESQVVVHRWPCKFIDATATLSRVCQEVHGDDATFCVSELNVVGVEAVCDSIAAQLEQSETNLRIGGYPVTPAISRNARRMLSSFASPFVFVL
jgi:hypothetical protein